MNSCSFAFPEQVSTDKDNGNSQYLESGECQLPARVVGQAAHAGNHRREENHQSTQCKTEYPDCLPGLRCTPGDEQSPATTINAPIPDSARAVHPQAIGNFIPDTAWTYNPSISQTGNMIQGVRIIIIPRITSKAPMPFTLLSNAMRKSRVEIIYVGIGLVSIFVSKNEINPIVYIAPNLCTVSNGIGARTSLPRKVQNPVDRIHRIDS